MIKMSSEEINALASEFTYSGSKAGVIGGYCEPDFPFYYANAEMVEMLGYDSLEELIQAIDGKVANTIHPDDMEQVSKDLGENYYEGLTYETTYRMPKKDGSWFWIVDKGKVVRADDGRLAIISICTDMTKFVHRQNELEAKNAAADYLFRNIPGGYHRCAMDEGYTFLYVSERFLNVLGWTKEELQTKFNNQFVNLIHPEDRNIAPEYVERIVNNTLDRPYQNAMYRLLCKDGYRWFSDTTVKVTVGTESFFQGVITDIDTFISEKQQRYEIISSLSSAYEEICQVDFHGESYQMISGPSKGETGNFAALKQAIQEKRITQADKAEIIGLLDGSAIQSRLRDSNTISWDIRANSGSWYAISVIVQNRDYQGNAVQILLAAQNITVQKQKELEYQSSLEEARDRADAANQAKTQFLFNMSHDIRTPMNAILGYSELAERSADLPEAVQGYLKKIQISGQGMLAILDNVLELSRIESGKAVLEETAQAAESVLESCMVMMNPEIEKRHHTVTVSKQIKYPYTYYDTTRLTEIILNILSNAIKYTADGGRIHCAFKQYPGKKKGWTEQELVVTDNGIGMSKAFQRHIFESFARERTTTDSGIPGTGLGMGIVKKLVDLMNGTISVESESGQGTTVTVRIPSRIAAFEDTQPKAALARIDRERLAGKRVLLAEDNDLNAEIASTLLAEEGLLVERAINGVECVEMLERSQKKYYDLILMDIQMPILDGYMATQKIRQLLDYDKANIPIIAMTANAFSEDRQQAIEMGMNDHVAKPIDMNVLTDALLKYI